MKETGCRGRAGSVVVVVAVVVIAAMVAVAIVALTISITSAITAGVRELDVGADRRCPASGETTDVDAGCRLDGRGLVHADCQGNLEDFFFVGATVVRHLRFKCCLGCRGCYLPRCSISHSTSSGRDRRHACRFASRVCKSSLGRQGGRAIRVRARAGGRVRIGRVVVVKVRNKEAEFIFV